MKRLPTSPQNTYSMSQANKRCGACLLFNTPKCTWLCSYEVKAEIKEVDSWEEFLEWIYTIDNKRPVLHRKMVRNTILPTDITCADFILAE